MIVADEPTQGVDASARGAIHAALAAAAADGAAIVAVYSEFEELFELADRIAVVRDGSRELDRPTEEVTQDEGLAGLPRLPCEGLPAMTVTTRTEARPDARSAPRMPTSQMRHQGLFLAIIAVMFVGAMPFLPQLRSGPYLMMQLAT